WKVRRPVGVRIIVRTGSSLIGMIRTLTPRSAAIRAVTRESGWPPPRSRVAAPEADPGVGPVIGHAAQAFERLAGEAPATLDVEPAGQGVRRGVEVGRDVESPDLGVVAGVADGSERARIEKRREASEELGGARAA